MQLLQSLGYVTASLPGVGGVLKAAPRDFEVEEIPAYEPCGQGEHLFLWLEKEATSADALTAHVSRVLAVNRRDIGVAGLKDTRAVTRQYLSVPASALARLPALTTPHIRLLGHGLHTNKLRTGHLRGNRFRMVLTGVCEDALERATKIACVLRQQGFANFYGMQRFGRAGETVEHGLALLRSAGKQGPARGPLRRLCISSVQSALFNTYLAERLRDDLMGTVQDGEVLQVCASGGPFVTDDVVREQARFAAREVVPAGPMFGPKMRPAQHAALAREEAVMGAAGLSVAHFAALGKLALGTRRANVVWIDDLRVATTAATQPALQLTMTLPPGSYATVVAREFTKNEALASAHEALGRAS